MYKLCPSYKYNLLPLHKTTLFKQSFAGTLPPSYTTTFRITPIKTNNDQAFKEKLNQYFFNLQCKYS